MQYFSRSLRGIRYLDTTNPILAHKSFFIKNCIWPVKMGLWSFSAGLVPGPVLCPGAV